MDFASRARHSPHRHATFVAAVGAATAVQKVATSLSLIKAIDAGARERAYELGGTLAATLME